LHDDRLFKFSGIAQNLSNSPVEPDAIEGRVVLDNVSKQIRECLEHAGECAQKAAELPNGSPFRQDFLQLEKRWLELARSIEFGEQLEGRQCSGFAWPSKHVRTSKARRSWRAFFCTITPTPTLTPRYWKEKRPPTLGGLVKEEKNTASQRRGS
jgi:hypothetical protein